MNPNTAALFDRVGLDYYCAGNRPLGDALKERGVPFDAFVGELARAAKRRLEPDWSTVPLGNLIKHIVEAHHEYLRRELPALDEATATCAHSSKIPVPALGDLHRLIHGLRRDLELQMRKEEAILFPAVQDLEDSAEDRHRVSPFGSVANLLRVTAREHEKTARELKELGSITQILGDSAAGLAELYARLQAFITNMHCHLHLENNILFPRAMQLEKGG